jgi:hypothetical protein
VLTLFAALQRFDTLRAAQAAPRHVALPDVLLLLTRAAEFDWVKLRRDEKALMKARKHVCTRTHAQIML